MIVYASEIFFPLVPIETILEEVSFWLGRKKFPIPVDKQFLYQTRPKESYGSQDLEMYLAQFQGQEYAWAMRYSHDHRGSSERHWVVELGIQRTDEHLLVTILLQTFPDFNNFSRPRLIKDLMHHLPPLETTAGLTLRTVDEAGLLALREEIDRVTRYHPIVLISQDSEGRYPIAPESLQDQLISLADVYAIPADVPTKARSEILHSYYNVSEGMIKIVWPPVVTSQESRPAEVTSFAHDQSQISKVSQDKRVSNIIKMIIQRQSRYVVSHHLTIELAKDLFAENPYETSSTPKSELSLEK